MSATLASQRGSSIALTVASHLVDQDLRVHSSVSAADLLHLRVPTYARLSKAPMSAVPGWRELEGRRQGARWARMNGARRAKRNGR